MTSMPDRGLPVEPSESAVEASAKALYEYAYEEAMPPWPDLPEWLNAQAFRAQVEVALAAAYAVDASPALSLTREEAEATIDEVIGTPRTNIEHGRACDRVLRKLRAFLQATEGQ